MVEQLAVNQLVPGSNPARGGGRTLSKATDFRSKPCKLLKLKIYYNRAKKMSHVLRGSSMVEQLTVNQLVPGSNPGRGADGFF